MSIVLFLFDDAYIVFDVGFTSHVGISNFLKIGSGLQVLHLEYGFLLKLYLFLL